ncbi:ABC transporter ATP-binding protein [Rhodovulum sp. P5]|uniref:ABC transporter ATP-binding protein n=1 Tax=Rhodovulum sp. P5 TaxID=1564506 RepID=UPI0009C25A05|nr:ABC transporter ATP-binding protein [Rhodovulum sp. P5]ARE39042.1 ABC transporter ATP-binding protein [Rhodovulum sp. P5]
MPQAPVLSIRDLGIAFGHFQAVERISLDIRAGETLALVGESGSGKSATALAILRLIEREGGRITGGSIRLGTDTPVEVTTLGAADLTRLRGNRISMVFQEPMTSLNPVMRIGEQLVEVLMRHQGLGRTAALKAAKADLDRVRIPDPALRLTQYPHELSGGLRQRVMIAMALACRPEVLIADEPTTALDVTTQAEILALIRSLQAELGMAVLFITHDMGVVAEMADRVLVLRNGQMIEEAPVTQLFAAPRTAYARELMAATNRLGSAAPKAPIKADPVLEVERLSTSFTAAGGMFRRPASRTVVKDVSLSLARGETLGLVGESGCGKSTLARSILRLVEPQTGRVRIDGEDMTALSPGALRAARHRAQIVFQDPFASLNPRLPVRDLVTEPAFLHTGVTGRDRRDLAVSLLDRVGLEPQAADRFPHQFSGGQRQRICIARALSVSPRVIVADEAVSALDVSIARRITDLMHDIQTREGIAFLFISHDIAVVERVSHRIAVMYAGHIVEIGPTGALLGAPRHPYTRRLLAAVPIPDPVYRRGNRPALQAGPGPSDWTDLPLREVGPQHFARVSFPHENAPGAQTPGPAHARRQTMADA